MLVAPRYGRTSTTRQVASSSTLPRGLDFTPLDTTVLAAGAKAQGKALEICRAI